MKRDLLSARGALAVLVLVGACTPHGPIVAGSSPSASTTQSAAASSSPSPTATPVAAGLGTWQLGPEMSSPRTDFAAVALPGGRVMLMGGESTFTTMTATVDMYHPATNTI